MFSGSTSATNFFTPRSRPAWARCSSSSCAMPAALVGVLDQEGDLGHVALAVLVHDPVEPADGDDLAGHGQHERDPVLVVDVGEPLARHARTACGIGAKNRKYFDSAETCS